MTKGVETRDRRDILSFDVKKSDTDSFTCRLRLPFNTDDL